MHRYKHNPEGLGPDEVLTYKNSGLLIIDPEFLIKKSTARGRAKMQREKKRANARSLIPQPKFIGRLSDLVPPGGILNLT